MGIFAAVMTGKGTGAIATIQICGESAKGIVEKIFKTTGNKSPDFKVGKIFVGTIADGNHTIDQVTIGCEGKENFAINCHGNPLIVERIMQLLRQQGAELETAEQMLCKTLTESNTIALEAKLALPKVKTIEGTKIILNQVDSGLSAAAKKWLHCPLNNIAAEAQKIIEAGEIAKFIIFGSSIVLAGPPNSGKSTLLNRLSGKQKAIVTNIKGTTRDWVSAECQIGKLSVELIDTAGLDRELADDVDKSAQQAALKLIDQADVILLVLDNSEPIEQLTDGLIKSLAGKIVLTVINKSDLPARLDTTKLPANLASNPVKISALLGTGIDSLAEKISQIIGVADFDIHKPICFTIRQGRLLTRLTNIDSQDEAGTIIPELLSARLSV